MSRRRKQKLNQPVQLPPMATAPASTPKPRLLKRLHDNSQHINLWGMLIVGVVAAVPPYVATYFQWLQIKDLKNQIAQQRELEVTPIVMIEGSRGRIPLTPYLPDKERNPLVPIKRADGIERQSLVPDTTDLVRVRNVGKSPAYNVMATVFFDKTVTKDTEYNQSDFKDKLTRERPPVSLKMIAPNDSVPFDHFHYPLVTSLDNQCVVGNFALYCMDGDGNERMYLQQFYYTLNFEDETPHALLDVQSPRLMSRVKANPSTTRTVAQVDKLFREMLRFEADQNNAKPKTP